MMIILDADHPYVSNFSVNLTEWTRGTRLMFRVSWRSFDTMKQDYIYNSIGEAENFAKSLKSNCHIINDVDIYDFENFKEHNQFWIELYPDGKKT